MSSKIIGRSRPWASSALKIDPYRKSARQTLDYDGMSSESEAGEDWNMIPEYFDETIQPKVKNGEMLSKTENQDENLTKTDDWQKLTANVDYEAPKPSKVLLHPADEDFFATPGPSSIEDNSLETTHIDKNGADVEAFIGSKTGIMAVFLRNLQRTCKVANVNMQEKLRDLGMPMTIPQAPKN